LTKPGTAFFTGVQMVKRYYEDEIIEMIEEKNKKDLAFK
jgi:hypothetical protein